MKKEEMKKNADVNAVVEVVEETAPVAKEVVETVKPKDFTGDESESAELETLFVIPEEKQPEPEAVEEPAKEDEPVAKPLTKAQEDYLSALERNMRKKIPQLRISDIIMFRTLGLEESIKAQRTPSHTTKDSLDIIDSALQGIDVGVITLGFNTDTNGICIVNGGSRTQDFCDFYNGKIGRKDMKWDNLTAGQAKAFLAHKVNIVYNTGTTKELARDFKNCNSNTALTGAQKVRGDLIDTPIETALEELNSHPIFKTMLSDRNLQKQEQNQWLYLIFSNILDCYNAKISKVVESLAGMREGQIDTHKLSRIFDLIESANLDISKYKFIHLAHLMYIGDCWKSKNQHTRFEADDVTPVAMGTAISVKYATTGVNSATENEKRIDTMSKKLYSFFNQPAKADEAPAMQMIDPSDL